MKDEVERFFRSAWYRELTSVDGEYLISKFTSGGGRIVKVKEYLGQAYRLDQRINSDIEELGKLREMSSSISSPTWEERVQTSRNTDAPFVPAFLRLWNWKIK